MGWFMVLRRQSFAGHTLSVIGFPGAAGAVLIGVAASYGYFAFCLAGGLVIAALPRTGRGGYSEESAVTGTAQSFALACGFLFVALYNGFLNGINALLFGSFLGITTGQVALLGAVAAVCLVILRGDRYRCGGRPQRSGACPVGSLRAAPSAGQQHRSEPARRRHQ
jgi:zinc/manganese transport system permease protein